MHAHKELKMVSKGRIRMVRHICSVFASYALVAAVFVCLSTSGAWAEDYWTMKYSNTFDPDEGVTHLASMDVVHLDEHQVRVYTLFSNDTSCASKMYWVAQGNLMDGLSYGSNGWVDIGNTYDLNFRLRATVFQNKLYVFYSPSKSVNGYDLNRIYYRTAIINKSETDLNDWHLYFSEEKSIYAKGDSAARISFATEMNGIMYVIYTSGVDWYYISSDDGVTFQDASCIMSTNLDTPLSPSGAVFLVPDAIEGFKEKLMVAYCPGGNSIKYFFFDGVSASDVESIDGPGPSVSSVRLCFGTAKGYTNDKYSIQAFIATHYDDTWSSIYHSEYIPSGANGDEGTWSSQWNLLDLSPDDRIHCRNPDDSDPNWAVTPFLTLDYDKPYDLMYTRMAIWYYKGIEHQILYDGVRFRQNVYASDILEHDPEATNSVVTHDLDSATVIGVIEGTPPFPVNGGVSNTLSSHVSTVELLKTVSDSYSTTWTVGASVAVSYGIKSPKNSSLSAKFSSGFSYKEEHSKTFTFTETHSLYSFTDGTATPKPNPGDLGWVLVLQPEIDSNQYILKSYSGDGLAYDEITDEFRVILIEYGDQTAVRSLPYYLENPAAPMGGSDPYPEIFEGMATRPLSTDMAGWEGVRDYYSQQNPSVIILNALPTIRGSAGDDIGQTTAATVQDAETLSSNASASVSASYLGILGVEGNVNYSMDIKTTTTMTRSIGFKYNMPQCDGSSCCVGYIDVTPVIYYAADYNAPWISNDIRYFKKPKPWYLSYNIYPSNDCSTTAPHLELSVEKANITLLLDRKNPNRDRVSGKISLKVFAPEFSLDFLTDEQLLHLRFGNYVVNSDANYVISRYIQGKKLVLELSKSEHSGDYYIVKLSYDKKKSQLKIDLKADEVDLSQLFHAYGLANVDQPSTGEAHTVPFRFFLSNKYHAEGNLFTTHCVVNKRNVICTLRSAK